MPAVQIHGIVTVSRSHKIFNHLLFIYSKDDQNSSGSDAAYLDNLRICTDPNTEATCSTVGFNNTETLGDEDDYINGETSADVCTDIVYSDSINTPVSRIFSDKIFTVGNSPIISRKGSSGNMQWEWLLLLSSGFLFRLRRKSA